MNEDFEGTEIERVSTDLVLPPDASLALVAERLVEQARHDQVSLTGDGGLLTGLVQQVMQTALDTELTDHLGYELHSSDGWGSGNSRNGSYPKTVATEIGDVRLDIPRDRNGSFEPQTVPVGSRRLSVSTNKLCRCMQRDSRRATSQPICLMCTARTLTVHNQPDHGQDSR